MEMLDILKISCDLKNYKDIDRIYDSDYYYYEGRSFQCGDFIRLQKHKTNSKEQLSFSGECCKCCLASTDYVVKRYNEKGVLVDLEELKFFFGEKLVMSRRDCFELPVLLMRKMIGDMLDEVKSN